MTKKPLVPYRKKRDFTHTPEPKSTTHTSPGTLHFVIQKHHSRTLHYDLRLEDRGVLKSWAIPKGPSTDPSHKQLALQTEDHPLEYAHFEGIIEEGNYGAGTVIVWDRGTFISLKDEPLATSIKKGEVTIWLNGEKLQGGYALVRTGYQGKKAWLFIKMNDEHVDRLYTITEKLPASVISGKTIEQLTKTSGKRSS